VNSFAVPTYEFSAIVYTALGALISFGRMGTAKVKTWALSPLLDKLFASHKEHWIRVLVELILFIVLGVVFGIAITEPKNVMQAVTAGLGWTALLAKYER
jgi:hypothetical protein